MSNTCSIILLFLYFLLSSYLVLGENVHQDHSLQTYIVKIQHDLKPTNITDSQEWYKLILSSMNLKSNSHIIHVYKTVFHGFSIQLTPSDLKSLEKRNEVIGIFPDVIYQLQTTRSPHFLGLNSYHNATGVLQESDLGSNIVIGVFDSGIWPESPSFNDDGLGPIPTHFKGECKGGEDFPPTLCNKKIVGVRYFASHLGFGEPKSARDSHGHGTHTASTMAGRSRPDNASFFGYAKGEATGIAPNARLAIYKVCWIRGCASGDVLAAFDKAIEDGVDIISISLGGPPLRYSMDIIAIGAFAAVGKGIFVSASAGNSGPFLAGVANNAPWMTTVGASTIDRTFPAELILDNIESFNGTSLYTGDPFPKNHTFPIVHHNSTWTRAHCMPHALDEKDAKGKIVVCLPGLSSDVDKGMDVAKVGAVGVVACVPGPLMAGNDTPIVSRPFLIPGLTLPDETCAKLLTYISSKQNVTATIVFHGTKIGENRAPIVAAFSSRGPNPQATYILKPDVVAPGVDILAAWPDKVPPTRSPDDPRRTNFNILSGTSMSCPHVSGIAALLKGSHPDWTPAMIRSALMTTAYKLKPDLAVASLWETGAGHVDPEKANDPGLVLDITTENHIEFLCASNYSEGDIKMIVKRSASCSDTTTKVWDLNYPAIIVPANEEHIVTRTLMNVGPENSTNYKANISHPKETNVVVEPMELSFKTKGEKHSFTVKVSPSKDGVPIPDQDMGLITWSDGKHNVTIPLVVAVRKHF